MSIRALTFEQNGANLEIVMYESTAFAGEKCWSDLDQCPIVKIKKENGVKVEVERIEHGLVPSAQDVAFIKERYPWKG